MAEMNRLMSDGQGPVLTCQKMDCDYNVDDCCYAGGIEVGDDHPLCDTYTTGSAAPQNKIANVMKCHVSDCFFNKQEDCHAAGITVGNHSGHADCLTARME